MTTIKRAAEEVEGPLRDPAPSRQDRRAQVEQQHALARRVLALLDEQLGRARGEPHLDARAVGALDDIEHRSLVEVGLGEDQLVG